MSAVRVGQWWWLGVVVVCAGGPPGGAAVGVLGDRPARALFDLVMSPTDSWACESPASADRLRACALAMNDVISRACRAWAQAMTRSQPPTRSNASNSWCFVAVSAGCASKSASRPSGTYCDQRTGSAVSTGRSSTRQSMISFLGWSDYRWRRQPRTASVEHMFGTSRTAKQISARRRRPPTGAFDARGGLWVGRVSKPSKVRRCAAG
jgi:hypothetical protein